MRHEKRRSTAALQNASEKYTVRITAMFWSAALVCRFRFRVRVPPSETASSSRDFDRDTPRRECGRGIARHEDQKSFRVIAHTDSQTPKEETDTNSVARDFCETKEGFADSIANRDAEEQVKAQENVSYSNTGRIAVGNRDSVRESGG